MNDAPIEHQLAAELRTFADWIETRPTIAEHLGIAALEFLNIFPRSDEAWQSCLREAGSFQKGANDKYLNGTVRVSEHIGICIVRAREDTCHQVQVGEREVTREVYPDDVEPVVVTEMEPVYEWVCPDSWLNTPAVA